MIMAEKTRYSDEELEEFRQIINDKLALAKRDYDQDDECADEQGL